MLASLQTIHAKLLSFVRHQIRPNCLAWKEPQVLGLQISGWNCKIRANENRLNPGLKPGWVLLCKKTHRETRRSYAMLGQLQVLITRGFLATRSFLRELADRFGFEPYLNYAMLAKWSVLIHMLPRYINFSTLCLKCSIDLLMSGIVLNCRQSLNLLPAELTAIAAFCHYK